MPCRSASGLMDETIIRRPQGNGRAGGGRIGTLAARPILRAWSTPPRHLPDLAGRNCRRIVVGMEGERALLDRITIDPGVCGGRPCVRGFRIRVSDILDLIAAGASFDEILADYAFLERDDIVAAIAYAARQTD